MRQQCNCIAQAPDLDQWRQVVNPTNEQWWWYLKPWWVSFDCFFAGGTLVFLTASLSLAADGISRLLSGGFDAVGAAAIAIPSILALMTSGSLTSWGKKVRRYVFRRLQLSEHSWEFWSCAIAFILLISLVITHQNYSILAQWFNERGEQHYLENRIDLAFTDYQRAIAFDPNDAKAHYELGRIYEDWQQYKQAKDAYQIAIKSGDLENMTLLQALNNLGRLYLLEGKYNLVFASLLKADNVTDEESIQDSNDYKHLHYTVLKNLGWAQLRTKTLSKRKACSIRQSRYFPSKVPATA